MVSVPPPLPSVSGAPFYYPRTSPPTHNFAPPRAAAPAPAEEGPLDMSIKKRSESPPPPPPYKFTPLRIGTSPPAAPPARILDPVPPPPLYFNGTHQGLPKSLPPPPAYPTSSSDSNPSSSTSPTPSSAMAALPPPPSYESSTAAKTREVERTIREITIITGAADII
jgi:hypothetical protein